MRGVSTKERQSRANRASFMLSREQKEEVHCSWGAGRLTGGRFQVIFHARNSRGRVEDKVRRRTKKSAESGEQVKIRWEWKQQR
jgi:hypothetical protein